MDQGPKDQNSETRDLSPADEGDNHDNVNLMDMELEPQLEDEIPSAADLLAGAFNISFATYEADLETSRKTTRPAEIDTLPFVNNVIQDGVEKKEDSTRPRRVLKPSVKLIANRLKIRRSSKGYGKQLPERFLSSRELRTPSKLFVKQ